MNTLILLTALVGGDFQWATPDTESPQFAWAITDQPDETISQSLPKITIRIAPFDCPPCDRVKAMDWSGFDVTWETGGKVVAYPEIFWFDDRGVRRYLTGAHTPKQVLWSLEKTKSFGQAPTPYSKIAEGLGAAGLKPGQSFVDIGCGDGRALLVAVEQFKASQATGVEIDHKQANKARQRTAGIEKISIIEGDATKVEIPKADVAYVYLYPEVLEKLDLSKFGTVVSYMHQVPGMQMRKVGDFYISGGVAATQVEWQRVRVNPWQVPGRECGNRSCVMCYGGYQMRRVRVNKPQASARSTSRAYCASCGK